mgnify:CR=1 FL=1
MKHLLDSVFTAVMLVGILALVSDGYGMYWAGVELKFKSKKWRALFKSLPFVLIIVLTFCFMRWN